MKVSNPVVINVKGALPHNLSQRLKFENCPGGPKSIHHVNIQAKFFVNGDYQIKESVIFLKIQNL